MVKSSSQKSSKKLLNSLMDTHTRIVHPVKRFALKSSMEFAARSLSIFNNLKPIETNHDAWMSENETIDSFDLNNNVTPTVEPPVAPVSAVAPDVFKKPARIPRKRKGSFSPYNRNMKKWIKYSLKDVPISSDATNTAVAMQFLEEQRKKREQNVEEKFSDDKIVFRKPSKRFMSKNITTTADPALASNEEVSKPHARFEEIPSKKSRTSNSDIKLLHLEDDSEDS